MLFKKNLNSQFKEHFYKIILLFWKSTQNYIYLEKMLIHVVPEVLEQSDFLGQGFWEHLQCVVMFCPVSLNILNISEREVNV